MEHKTTSVLSQWEKHYTIKQTHRSNSVKIEGANHNNLSTNYGMHYWPPIHEFIEEIKKEPTAEQRS